MSVAYRVRRTAVRRLTPRMHSPCVTTFVTRARTAEGMVRLHPVFGAFAANTVVGVGRVKSVRGAEARYDENVEAILSRMGKKKGSESTCWMLAQLTEVDIRSKRALPATVCRTARTFSPATDQGRQKRTARLRGAQSQRGIAHSRKSNPLKALCE